MARGLASSVVSVFFILIILTSLPGCRLTTRRLFIAISLSVVRAPGRFWLSFFPPQIRIQDEGLGTVDNGGRRRLGHGAFRAFASSWIHFPCRFFPLSSLLFFFSFGVSLRYEPFAMRHVLIYLGDERGEAGRRKQGDIHAYLQTTPTFILPSTPNLTRTSHRSPLQWGYSLKTHDVACQGLRRTFTYDDVVRLSRVVVIVHSISKKYFAKQKKGTEKKRGAGRVILAAPAVRSTGPTCFTVKMIMGLVVFVINSFILFIWCFFFFPFRNPEFRSRVVVQ